MRISKPFMFALLVSGAFFTSEANAGIPTGETVIKVLDLPDIEMLHRKDGGYVDLGYHFSFLYGGQWVGYVGSSRKYVELDKDALEVLLLVGGVKELPPVPSRPSWSMFMTGFFYVAFAFAPFGWWKKYKAKQAAKHGQPMSAPMPRPERENYDSEPNPALLAKMMNAAEQYKQTAPASTNSTGFGQSQGAPVTFGKRIS
jgi:hypothetical protein